MNQATKTEIVIADAGITGYPGRHQLQLDALHSHARDLARKMDELEEQLTLAKNGKYARALWQANRDLRLKNESIARKLDAVKAECDRWCNSTSESIAAIVEGE